MTKSILQANPGELAKFFAWFEKHTRRGPFSWHARNCVQALKSGCVIIVRDDPAHKFGCEISVMGGAK